MDLHENSHLHRCCICVIIASGLLAVGNNDFRGVCYCVSGRLPLWSIPFLRLQWHTDILCAAIHEHFHVDINSHTYIYTLTHKQTHTHKSISQTVKSKAQRWINRRTEDPRTTAITLSHDSIQGICPVTSKHALCHQARKTCLSCCPLSVMCSPTRRSKYNYSASQWTPFIFSCGKSSPGSDLNTTARSYHRIFESKAGESRGIILLWRANAFTPTQIDSPWQKRLCCLF